MVDEGDLVWTGQPLAQIEIDPLQAQLDEARAQHQEATQSVSNYKAEAAARESDKAAAQALVAQRNSDLASVQSVVSQRESDLTAANADVAQREADFDAAQSHLNRSSVLSKDGAASVQELDDDRARLAGAAAKVNSAKADAAAKESAVTAAKAQVAAAEAAIATAKAQLATSLAKIVAANAQVAQSQRSVEAYKAKASKVEVDIRDSTLICPRDGRVQFKISQAGEVLPSGGRVLNLVDLGDVYMTFFLPDAIAGKVAIGSEARIVLDAAPHNPIPAWISFVASVAQFTPKTVETQAERQKLMFRCKAQIDRELLKRHMADIKTGLPGVAWVKIDPQAKWPPELESKVHW
jgi:HlyD family secretion protein